MRAFLVKLPSLVRYWTVVDDGYRVVRVADEYLRHLRLGQDAAESTTKAYAEALALYLRWCEQSSRDWRTAVERLGGFITWLKHTPSDPDAPVSRVPRVQRIPERSSNRSAREARPPALLLPRSVFAADHPAPEYFRIRDEDPLTVRHVRRLRDGDPGAEYLSQRAVGGPRAVLAGQEIMHGRVAEQPDAGRHFQWRGVLGAHVGEQRHEPPKVCFLLCQSLAARSGGCVVRGMGVSGAAWCLPGHLVPAFCAGGIGEKVPRKPGRRSLGRAGSGA